MNKYLAGYLAVAVVMIGLDMLWLGAIATTTYRKAIGHLMAEQPNLLAALVFYVVYAGGLMVFAIAPQAQDPGWSRAALMGALLGFVAYATYDLSNLATLRNWPVGLTIVDMAWGTVVSGVSAGAGKFAMGWAARI